MSRIDPDVLANLALFPLPSVVLFPGALLPVHVFERRYVQMVRDCMGRGKLIGIARLQPGYEESYFERPTVWDIAGLGEIVDANPLTDDRFNILVRGLHRIRIEEEHPDGLYRTARVQLLDDQEPADVAAFENNYQRLAALCNQLALYLGQAGAQLRKLVRTQGSPGRRVAAIAAALVTDPDARQVLLCTLDPTERVNLLIDHVGDLLVANAPPSSLN
jgi:Lon protease-like protein